MINFSVSPPLVASKCNPISFIFIRWADLSSTICSESVCVNYTQDFPPTFTSKHASLASNSSSLTSTKRQHVAKKHNLLMCSSSSSFSRCWQTFNNSENSADLFNSVHNSEVMRAPKPKSESQLERRDTLRSARRRKRRDKKEERSVHRGSKCVSHASESAAKRGITTSNKRSTRKGEECVVINWFSTFPT